jgi:hypothetical protein
VWAADLASGYRWLRGRLAVPRTALDGPRAEGRVTGLRIQPDGGLLYVANDTSLVLGSDQLQFLEVTDEAGATSEPLRDDDLVLADASGPFTGLKVVAVGGEGDDCGGAVEFGWNWMVAGAARKASGYALYSQPC